MARKSDKPKALTRADPYVAVLTEVVGLLDAARRASARAVNAVMTATYWQVGRRIVEGEQEGQERAGYGVRLLERLSADLTERSGRGFSLENVRLMRNFYLAFPGAITQTSSGESQGNDIRQTASAVLAKRIIQTPSGIFPLPWSHYVKLLSVKNPEARKFYEAEALRGGWTVKQLERQVGTQFYERTLMSRNKAAMLTKHNRRRPDDAVTAEEEIKDPLVLEFLGLKDEYSETEMEEVLVRELETFLLELGNDFTFIGRQRRLRVGNAWYRVDLLLFHRRLRCLVIIDLKTGEFTHADAGQMHLYCNYARAHWTNEGENPPVGLILCTEKDAAVARYALDGLPNKVLAAEYRTALPDERVLAAEVERARRLLESRRATHARRTGRPASEPRK